MNLKENNNFNTWKCILYIFELYLKVVACHFYALHLVLLSLQAVFIVVVCYLLK